MEEDMALNKNLKIKTLNLKQTKEHSEQFKYVKRFHEIWCLDTRLVSKVKTCWEGKLVQVCQTDTVKT